MRNMLVVDKTRIGMHHKVLKRLNSLLEKVNI
jgi:hypothetical protein